MARGKKKVDAPARRLRLGLPKGSLQDTTEKLFALAGFDLRIRERSYYPDIDDPEIECVLIRAQEMARYVEQGVLDAGITGHRLGAREPRAREGARRPARAVAELPPGALGAGGEGRLADPGAPTDLRGQAHRHRGGRASPSAICASTACRREVEFSWGATEVKPPLLADAIVDVTETGSSLRANKLRVIDTVLESTPRFIANRDALRRPVEARKIDRMRAAAARRDRRRRPRRPDDERAARAAAARARRAARARHADHLDARRRPLGRGQHGDRRSAWCASCCRGCARRGARGIVEYPLNKIIE